MQAPATKTGHLKNGDQVIFNTDPPTMVTVIGVFEDAYAILWSESGTVADTQVKKITFEQYRDARKQGLISLIGEPPPWENPKKIRKKRAKKASPETPRMPWAK